MKTVVERLSKLARVLKHYYPCYKNCLERIEAKIGTPVCKLDTPRQCPTNLTQINRWKFICELYTKINIDLYLFFLFEINISSSIYIKTNICA